jgi:hypothetical protein
MPQQRYSLNDRRKNFIINHNERVYGAVRIRNRVALNHSPTLYLLSYPDGFLKFIFVYSDELNISLKSKERGLFSQK